MIEVKKIVLEEKRELFWKTGNLSEIFRSLVKITRATAQLPGQAMNSIFDALYFIDLKRKPRIVHVKDYIQGFQAGLLFTCKCLLCGTRTD